MSREHWRRAGADPADRRRWAAWVAVVLLATQAAAWDDRGHRSVAGAAFARLDAAAQSNVAGLLEKHPRFEADFSALLPQGLGPAQRRGWLIKHAATWPDLARRFDHEPARRRDALVERYHRGRWHYVNLPIYLEASEGSWAPQPAGENVVNVLRQTLRVLLEVETPAADRAVRLCWLLHLVADIHQPLHSSALFDRARFPKGDRGGNDVVLAREDNLHAFWDRIIKTELELDATVVVDGAFAPRSWARESHRYAERYVYTPEIRAALAAAKKPGGKVRLSRNYRAQAHVIARERMGHAAARLARVLVRVAAAAAPPK